MQPQTTLSQPVLEIETTALPPLAPTLVLTSTVRTTAPTAPAPSRNGYAMGG